MAKYISFDDARALTGTALIVSMVRFARTSEAGNSVFRGRLKEATVDIIVPAGSPAEGRLRAAEAAKTSALVEGSALPRAYTHNGKAHAGLTFVTVTRVEVIEPRVKAAKAAAVDTKALREAARKVAQKKRWSDADRLTLHRWVDAVGGDTSLRAAIIGNRKEEVRQALA